METAVKQKEVKIDAVTGFVFKYELHLPDTARWLPEPF
jgi:hypothetical protein